MYCKVAACVYQPLVIWCDATWLSDQKQYIGSCVHVRACVCVLGALLGRTELRRAADGGVSVARAEE